MSVRIGSSAINLLTSSSDIYVGQSVNGKKSGIGTMYYDTGVIHICKWNNDVADGHGICHMPDGTEYVGDWRNGMFHGRKNEIVYKNGDYYNGNVRKNAITGRGKMTYADGRQYNGDWNNGVWHGTGELTYSTKDVYRGGFVNGRRETTGMYTWANGNTYDGEWKNDEMYDGIVMNKKQGIVKQWVLVLPGDVQQRMKHD
jgi:hypothetical protein